MAEKLTPWFPIDTTRPDKPGVYRLRTRHGAQTWSRWNGKNWCWTTVNKTYAAEQTRRSPSVYATRTTVVSWRGLAQEPKNG